MAGKLECLKCDGELYFSAELPDLGICQNCRTHHEVALFPAYFNKPRLPETGQRLVVDNQSSCFNHPSKKAEVVCQDCGRFLCTLCATEFNGRQVCLQCLSNPEPGTKNELLQTRRVLYDDVALGLAIGSIFLWFAAIIMAPAAMYLVIKHWREGPTSPLRQDRTRYVIAFIISLIIFM